MSHERGFTVLETTAVVLIAGILLASTLPGVFEFRSTLRRGQAREQLMQHILTARQSAVTQRAPVFVAFGDGVGTTDVTSYTVHVDTNGNGVKETSESRKSFTLPPETRLFRVALQPTDSLIFDISGVLMPGTSGGSLVVVARSVPETLIVSGAGMVYRQ